MVLGVPTDPIELSNIAVTPPFQRTQSLQHEWSQQSPASRIPSLENLMHMKSPHYPNFDVSSGGCDGTTTNNTSGMVMDGTAHPSFRNLGPASFSQGNTMRNGHGSISSQCLQYDGQHRTTADLQQGQRDLRAMSNCRSSLIAVYATRETPAR